MIKTRHLEVKAYRSNKKYYIVETDIWYIAVLNIYYDNISVKPQDKAMSKSKYSSDRDTGYI